MPELRRGRKSQDKKEVAMDYKNSDISKIIDEYIHHERNRAILKRRLIDGCCYEPLAEEFDLSVRQVKKIVYKEQETVFRQLRKAYQN